jgi:hypothetical protein
MSHPSPVTRLDLFTVRARAVPGALVRMAIDRRHLHRARPRFWKLLGTGDGRTFDARDADLRRWGVLTVWPDADAAAGYPVTSPTVARWRTLGTEHWWATLRAARSTGSWSGAAPFGPPFVDVDPDAPLAAITRARLRWSRAPRFWRSIAPVNADLGDADGLLLRMGIGEAPLGLQGTFSLWTSPAALRAFAYRGAPHRDVVRRSTDERWYAEELFARFAVADHGGTIFGHDPLAIRRGV